MPSALGNRACLGLTIALSPSTQGMIFIIFTLCSLHIQYGFTIYSLDFLKVCKCGMLCVNSHSVAVYSLYIHYMFTIYSLYIHYIFAMCSLYIHHMFTIYSLYVHYMFTICSPCVHYIFTRFFKSLQVWRVV